MKQVAVPYNKSGGEMPVRAHVAALRGAVLVSFAALLICFAVAFYFADVLMAHFKHPADVRLIFLSPAEALWSEMKVALYTGFLCALPVILYQAWKFIEPALTIHERDRWRLFFLLTPVAFLLGNVLCYFFVLPIALDFLIGYGRQAGIAPHLSISLYVDFHLKFLLGFGLIFEGPLAIVLLSMLGVLTPEFLERNRKYAALLALVIAAILTPTPDIFNQVIMAFVILLLYEIGIITARVVRPISKEDGRTRPLILS